jgi:Na+/proline symporter
MLVLGIWWRGLTDRGAMAGLIVGGGTSTLAVVGSMLGLGARPPSDWLSYGWLLERPAIVTVPLVFLVTVVVSKMTASRVLPDMPWLLLRLHAPERLGLGQKNGKGEDVKPEGFVPGFELREI